MRVKEIIIHNFKSIAKDCFLKVDKDVTTLVGASQSGKTNVLRAIEKFTTGNYAPDDICDFSDIGRSLPPDPNMPMITITFDTVESNEVVLEEISPKLVSMEGLKVTRKYNGEYSIDITGVDFADSELSRILEQISKINQQLDSLLSKCREEWEAIDEELSEASQQLDGFKTAIMYPTQIEPGAQSPRLSEALEPMRKAFSSLFDVLVEEPEQASEEAAETEGGQLERQKAVEQGHQLISEIESLVKRHDEITIPWEDIVRKLTSLLPSFMYVGAEHGNMLRGEVSLDELEAASEDDVNFASVHRLLKLAKLDVARLATLESRPRRSLLQSASKRVTEVLQKIWRQQMVEISLELAERRLQIWVKSDGGPDRFPEHQGYGFRWYLEFYLSYAMAVGKESNTVLLLDEAGIHMHPFAQRNLVEVLREIATHTQVIHTTHLPDMLDLENPERWRVAENNEESRIGTQIINEAYQPREEKIGFEIVTKALWGSVIVPALTLGPQNFFVEGASDGIYLRTVSRILGKDDPNNALLVTGEVLTFPVHGLPRYQTLLIFCNRPGFNTVALFDSDVDGKRTKQQLIKNGILSPNKAIEINDVYPSSPGEERDIESMFGFNLLKEAAMQVYKADLPDGFDFKSDSLPTKGGLGKKFKEFFESQGIELFDKTKVAEALKTIISSDPGRLPESNQKRFTTLLAKIRDAFQVPVSG